MNTKTKIISALLCMAFLFVSVSFNKTLIIKAFADEESTNLE